MLAVKQYGIKLPDVSWDADNAQWIDTNKLRG